MGKRWNEKKVKPKGLSWKGTRKKRKGIMLKRKTLAFLMSSQWNEKRGDPVGKRLEETERNEGEIKQVYWFFLSSGGE